MVMSVEKISFDEVSSRYFKIINNINLSKEEKINNLKLLLDTLNMYYCYNNGANTCPDSTLMGMDRENGYKIACELLDGYNFFYDDEAARLNDCPIAKLEKNIYENITTLSSKSTSQVKKLSLN